MSIATVAERQLVDIPTAAARLACSRGHIYHLIRAGRLHVVDIRAGGTRSKARIFADELEAFIEAATVSPASTG